MAIVQGDVLRVVVTFDMPAVTVAQNVFHVLYQGQDALSETAVVAGMLAWADDMYDQFASVMSQNVSMNSVEVSKLISSAPAVYMSIGTIPGTFVGLVPEQSVSHGVALVARAGIFLTSKLARKYIPGIAETFVEQETWGTQTLAAATAFVIDWLAGTSVGVGNDFIAGVYSVVEQGFEALGGLAAVSTIPGYQRRRKPGVGI